jgi:hypothetical protein
LEGLDLSLVFVLFQQEEFCMKNLRIYQKYKKFLNRKTISNLTLIL